LATILGFSLGLFLNRFLYISLKKNYINARHRVKNILIIGYNNTAKKLATYLEKESINTEILGFIENTNKVKELSNYPIIGDLDSTIELSKQFYVDEIFSTITPEQDPRLYELMQQVENECIRFKIVPDFSVFVKGPVHVSYFNDMPIVTLRGETLETFNNKLKKRIFDVVVSFLVIVFILSWLIPLISLCIFIESPGPIFFMQWRTGKNRRNFRCYKFRSMFFNTDSDLKQASKTDKRITKVGKILRQTSLDEFPQFINVFLGNMSIVGPRPHMIHHTNEYSKIVNQYMVRLFSKPGITGWAQINGFRGEITEPRQIKKRVEYDLWYMENWNLLLDIKIVFLTVINIVRGEKNAF
jgi:putative colanic acid biosynthesis UDP-glucose lipid carrier transferase